MKKYLKIAVLFLILYGAVWFTLSGTEAGTLGLQVAAKYNNGFLGRVLMALGANPKDKGQDGMAALHFAGFLGADALIPTLIENGAPINLTDKEGRTALHLAAYAGKDSSVSLLMDHKADPEIRENQGGMTALHLAVAQKHGPVVQVLLEKGANPSPKEKNGYTPLFIADNENLDDIVTILENFKAR